MTNARQITRAAAVLLAVGVCALPPRADGTIPRSDLRTAALIPHPAPFGLSLPALHLSSPGTVLTLSDAAVSGMCRNGASTFALRTELSNSSFSLFPTASVSLIS